MNIVNKIMNLEDFSRNNNEHLLMDGIQNKQSRKGKVAILTLIGTVSLAAVVCNIS